MMPARLLALFRASGAAFATAGALALSMLAAPAAHAEALYGAVATDEAQAKLYWVMPETSAGEAKQGALAKCNKAGAKGCKSVTAFSDSCVALARNSRNDLFWGNSVSAEIAAKKAIRTCTNDSADGKCKLAAMPLCAGPGYSEADLKALHRHARPARSAVRQTGFARLLGLGRRNGNRRADLRRRLSHRNRPSTPCSNGKTARAAAPCSPIPTPASAWPGARAAKVAAPVSRRSTPTPSPPAMKRAQPATPRAMA